MRESATRDPPAIKCSADVSERQHLYSCLTLSWRRNTRKTQEHKKTYGSTVTRRFISVHMLSDENVDERMGMWPRRDEVLNGELKDTGTDSPQVSSEVGKQQSQGTRQNQGLHVIINLYSKPEAGTGTYWHTNTHTSSSSELSWS